MPYEKTLINIAPTPDSLRDAMEKVNQNFSDIQEAFENQPAGSSAFDYHCTALTGGGQGALDAVDGAALTGGETAITFYGSGPTRVMMHTLDAFSGEEEDAPWVIAPDANAGTKRWILAGPLNQFWITDTDPTANNDAGEGIMPGDYWRNGTNLWVCVNNAEGAAVWRKLLVLGTTTGTAAEGDHTHDDYALASALTSHTNAVSPHSKHATLNENDLVVQNPANATATPGTSKIPISDETSGKLDAWVSDAGAETKGKIQLAGNLGGTAASPEVVGLKEGGGQSMSIGAIGNLQPVRRNGTSLEGYDPPSASSVPAGTLLDFAGTSIPDGWLECNGQAVSRETYADLFTAIGTTWGVGDGSTTFNVPDLRRRTTVGAGGSGSGTLGNAVGDTGGEESHTLAINEMPAHNHGGTTGEASIQYTGSGSLSQVNRSVSMTAGNSAGAYLAHSHSISSQGSGAAHNIMQPSAVVKKIIKA